VHNSLPYDKAGYAIRTHSIVTNLKDEIDLEVVTRAGYPWDLLKHRGLPFKEKDIIDGVEYIRLFDKNKTFKKGSDLNYINVYADEIIRIVKEKNSTILHASSNYLNALATLKASETLKLPVVYEMRGLWYVTRTTLDPHFKDNGMYEYEHQMEKSCAMYADRVVVISEALKNLVISWGVEAQKIKVIPNAVDITKFQPLSKDKTLCEKYNLQGKTVVGFLGSLTKYEGIKELVIAINELTKEGYDDIVLIIVGDGREKIYLESLVESKNIIFTGRVSFEEVDKYYSLFDICPFPRNDYEVCRYVPPLKVLEAMAMQKAIIVSDVAPLLEMVENEKTALVCKADSVIDLKIKILELYANQDKIAHLGYNARIWVQTNRNWSEVSKKYEEIYNGFI
jgi:glycosyltransferase involved in cell wall biosynthesis